jgi:HEPN domain-containing protein
VAQIIEQGDKKALIYLFEQLKEIRILDPAVGSAHFLESAIDVLVDIYEKIWDKARELRLKKGLEIVAADDRGRIEQIELLDISDEKLFKLYVKFFIILSKNIYGVDISPGALKVAKARLFLTLAKHFDVRRSIFIRFPNVHFNLREGNSLIGYVEMGRPEGQATLDFFVKEGDAGYITKSSIEVVSELKGYLLETAKALGIEGNILKDVEELNRIVSRKKIEWRDFEKVLRTKEKLIRVLIASLNSQYARPLNTLLNNVTALFNQKLDEKFAREQDIELSELREIKTFHWLFEFPEVFLERGGFDVVVGNPPFLRQEIIKEPKEILNSLYPEVYSGTSDYSVFFVKRSFELTIKDGYHSFIITNKWLTRKYGEKLKSYLKENLQIEQIIDFGENNPFVGITNYVLIYVIKNTPPPKNNSIFYCAPQEASQILRVQELGYPVAQESLEGVWTFTNEFENEIKKWAESVGKPLKEWDVKIYRGITTGLNDAFIIDFETMRKIVEEDEKSKEILKPVITGKEIERYYCEWKGTWIIKSVQDLDDLPIKYPAVFEYLNIFKEKLEIRVDQGNSWYNLRPCIYYDEFEKPKIMWQWTSKEPSFVWDIAGMYAPNNVFIMTHASKYILALLNSRLITWYFEKISPKVRGGTLIFAKAYIEPIPLVEAPKNIQQIFETLTNYILYIKSKKDIREKLSEVVEFFDERIIDSLVYELYFRDVIYITEDIVDFFDKHINLFDEIFDEIFKKTPEYKKLYEQNKQKIFKLIRYAPEILKNLHPEDYNTINEWINDAKEDLDSCKREFNEGNDRKAIKNLHEALEKLVKAYALYFGLLKEEKLKTKISHKPLKVYTKLLKEHWIGKVAGLFNIDVNSQSLDLLEKLSKFEKQDKNEVIELDKGIKVFISYYENVMNKVNKQFSKKETKILIEIVKPYKDIKNLCQAMLGFSILLFPLSAIIPIYYFPSRYPDERRKLSIDFKDTELIKNIESILDLIENNIEKLTSLIEEEKKIKQYFTLLSSSIERYLKPISYDRWARLYWKKQLEGELTPEEEKELEKLENENLKTIEEVYESISMDEKIKELIEKIKAHEWVRVVEG